MNRSSRHLRRAERQRRRRRQLESGRHLRASFAWAHVVQALAFVRKELAEIVRQPRLLLLLVVGPFVLLLLFGAGYRNTDVDLRTQFVGPEGSIYEDAIGDYEAVLEGFVESAGFTSDEAMARQRLDEGDVDVVVIFPSDPLDTILHGESARIEILHEELDPIRQSALDIAARLAVQEVNASVLGLVVGDAQDTLQPISAITSSLLDRAASLGESARTGDQARVAESAASAAQALSAADAVVATTESLLARLGGDDQTVGLAEVRDRLDDAGAEANAIATERSGDTAARAQQLEETLRTLAADLPTLTTLDPAVLVRPFESATENLLPVDIDPTDFFAPSSIALLLQHLAVTFAALSLVRDRELGLFELLRVGPLSSSEIVIGKTVAYLVVGGAVGALLIAGAVYGLDVPFEGDVRWAAAALGLVLLASLALGIVLSLISRTETQAVQFAMLSLLAGLFFSGFILEVEGLAMPYRSVAYLLPVTYGINAMQDVMLRGEPPSRQDLIGLGALVVGYGVLAVMLLRRRLRTE